MTTRPSWFQNYWLFFSSNFSWFCSFPLPWGMRKTTTNIFILVNFASIFLNSVRQNLLNKLKTYSDKVAASLHSTMTVSALGKACISTLLKSEKNTVNTYFITSHRGQCLQLEMTHRLWMFSSQFSILLQHEIDITQTTCLPCNCVYFNCSFLPSIVNESHIILCYCHYSSLLPRIHISST